MELCYPSLGALFYTTLSNVRSESQIVFVVPSVLKNPDMQLSAELASLFGSKQPRNEASAESAL